MSAPGRIIRRRAGRDQGTEREIEDRLNKEDPRIIEQGEHVDRADTPENVLGDVAKQLKDKDTIIENERKAREAAEARAAQSAAQAGANANAAVQRQEEQIKGAVTAAEARHAAAKSALKTARDAGNNDAELEAIGELTDAAADVKLAKQNQIGFENWKAQRTEQLRRQPPPQQTRTDGPSREARMWLAKHPAYNVDSNYRAEAMAAHELALVNLGEEKEGTQEYVDFIDKHMESLFGKNHGQVSHGRQEGDVNNRNPNRAISESAPRGEPARQRTPQGQNLAAYGDGELEYEHTDGSLLRLVRGRDRDGKPFETVEGTIPAEWLEYAKVSNMTPTRYAIEQIKIVEEMQNGGQAAGLTMNRNGVYS